MARVADNVKIDGLGYGSITGGNLGEGNPVTATTGTNGYKRSMDGDDTDDNSADFSAVTATNIYVLNQRCKTCK